MNSQLHIQVHNLYQNQFMRDLEDQSQRARQTIQFQTDFQKTLNQRVSEQLEIKADLEKQIKLYKQAIENEEKGPA